MGIKYEDPKRTQQKTKNTTKNWLVMKEVSTLCDLGSI